MSFDTTQGPGSTWAGPLISGTKKDADANGPANTGLAVLSQRATVTYAGGATANATMTLPSGSQILNILADTTTAWNTGGTTPAATLTVGATEGGTDYLGSASVLTAGRATDSFTATELANMQNIGSNTTVNVTVTQSAASGLVDATEGQTTVTLLYVQTVQPT